MAIGGFASLMYFKAGQATRPYNFYMNLHNGFVRLLFGSFIGGAIGYNKFGDRQKLHNAWVAERLRRRYPEAMSLTTANLWQFKGVTASQEFYRWR